MIIDKNFYVFNYKNCNLEAVIGYSSSKYSCFCFFAQKNCNANIAVASIFNQLQISVFTSLFIKIGIWNSYKYVNNSYIKSIISKYFCFFVYKNYNVLEITTLC